MHVCAGASLLDTVHVDANWKAAERYIPGLLDLGLDLVIAFASYHHPPLAQLS